MQEEPWVQIQNVIMNFEVWLKMLVRLKIGSFPIRTGPWIFHILAGAVPRKRPITSTWTSRPMSRCRMHRTQLWVGLQAVKDKTAEAPITPHHLSLRIHKDQSKCRTIRMNHWAEKVELEIKSFFARFCQCSNFIHLCFTVCSIDQVKQVRVATL